MEIVFFRMKPFRWIYFNWGEYYLEKRIIFEIYVEIRGKIRGFSIGWSREFEPVREKKEM